VRQKTIARVRSHSYSELEKVRNRHLHLDVRPDFANRQLSCVATLDVQRAAGWRDCPVILDTERLSIDEVLLSTDGSRYASAHFELGPIDKVLGQPLIIDAPEAVSRIKIKYRTSPDATALQWLEPEQTSTRTFPFLFTQSQSIHARSWIPLQDTPAARLTFSAVVHPPEGMIALMSAGNNQEKTSSGSYKFYMEHPVPPYLIALAIGRLDFQATGFRTGVYAEPTVVDSARHEFADTEAMIETAERLYGPYRWGRYDLLVLPPSFPYGGMENPRLTFLTPTVITGDRSLVSLIAHELAHSWAGNLVTNANWGDFWLNEGFTTYIEHRIQEAIYGRDRVEVEQVLSRLSLVEEMSKLEERDQLLDSDFTGRNPDEAITDVPYVKGALFLQSLEETVGRKRFDQFLRGYFDHFAFQSVTTAVAIEYLEKELLSDGANTDSVPLEDWLSKPGLPESTPHVHAKLLEEVKRAAVAYKLNQFSFVRQWASGWDTHQWLYFISEISSETSREQMAVLDEYFDLSESPNSEIRAQWLLLSVKKGYKHAEASVKEFLRSVGRLKYIKPIYEELVKSASGLAIAKSVFEQARAFYHPIARTAITNLFAAATDSHT
jgi:leukotriene-A4 hydrolase